MGYAADLPPAADTGLVGTYPGAVKAGGRFVWGAVLEYRVWCHPERGAPDEAEGSDYFYAFANYPDALAFSQQMVGCEERSRWCFRRSTSMSPSMATTSTSRNAA